MLAQQRQAAILDRVRAAGGVRVSELANEYGVSDMTIRRDLETLADRGLLAKVHGGATTVSPGIGWTPVALGRAGRSRQTTSRSVGRRAGLRSQVGLQPPHVEPPPVLEPDPFQPARLAEPHGQV